MKIELVKTLAEPEDRRTVWSREDAPELFDELHLVGELVAELLVSPEAGDRFLLTGKLSGTQNLTCSRTLEPFDRPFSTEMVVEVTRSQVASQELDEEDADVYAYRIRGLGVRSGACNPARTAGSREKSRRRFYLCIKQSSRRR